MNVSLPQWLARRLSEPLPGPMVGTRFEPAPSGGKHYHLIPAGARQAAVLILLYPHEDRWHLPLTLRPSHLPDHAGQISLPGGAIEPGETGAQAALREFHEELGAPEAEIRLLGNLSPIYVHASNFRVEPWLGVCDHRPAMAANPEEVAQLFEVPLDHLLDPSHFGCHPRHVGDLTYLAPHFLWGEHRIWGATCMILGEFVTILEQLPPEPG